MIQERLTRPDFPWYFRKDITYSTMENLVSKDIDSFGFEHSIYSDKTCYSEPIFNFLSGFFGALSATSNNLRISKSRIDMTVYNGNDYKHTPHVDLEIDHLASIFYITNSDGETEIYNETCHTMDQYESMDLTNLTVKHKIIPKENRLLIFDGRYLHTGHSPSKTKTRIIINTDLT